MLDTQLAAHDPLCDLAVLQLAQAVRLCLD